MSPSRKKPYTAADCASIGCSEPQGKVVVFNIDKLGEKYKKPHYQLYYVSQGEELSPCLSFLCTSLYDEDRLLINLEDVIGVMDPDQLPAYAKLILDRLINRPSSEQALAN